MIWSLKPRLLGETEIAGADEIVKVTGIFCGLSLAPGAVTAIVPLYVPAVRPAPFALTLSIAGVVPLSGDTASQFGPEVDTTAEKLTLVALLAIERFCAGNGAPDGVEESEKVRLVGETISCPPPGELTPKLASSRILTSSMTPLKNCPPV